MKALFINGSPRKNWNTHKLLESAMKGTNDSGAETELIHLYDFTFKGCVSCFACKLKGNKTNGVCAIRDVLRPVLEKANQSEIVVIGSPIYFSYPTGPVRSFMERLMFPVLSYNKEKPATIPSSTRATAMIYAMGAPKQYAESLNYPIILGENERFLRNLFGYCESMCSYYTYQFNDLSRYEASAFDEESKAKYRDEQFPKDLQAAYELGKRLVEKAKA